jgi:hypothetical protein
MISDSNTRSEANSTGCGGVILILASIALIFSYAPLGIVSFAAPFPSMAYAWPAIIPTWIAILGATGYGIYTQNKKAKSVVTWAICIFSLLNLSGCAFEIFRFLNTLR